jgi:hypothetical protein
MPFVDLSEFLTENDLVIHGLGPRDYTVPAPDVERGLRYNALSAIAIRVNRGETVTREEMESLRLNDDEERQFAIEILTQEVVDQMAEDGLPWPAVTRTAQYAYTHFAISPEAAKKAFEAGVFSGKGLTPPTNRAARRTTTATRSARPASAASKKPR